LTPIQLSAQRLRKRYIEKLADDSKVFDDCTRTIINQVEELKRLVNEFSLFARLPATNPALNSLEGVVEESITLYRDSHKDIDFVTRVHQPIPQFYFDREQIKRVMINLFDNALAAMEGHGKIETELFYDSSNPPMVRIEVSDTGKGIAPGDRERLFEPYFSTKKGGTGLGLSIVSTIISDHNGYIRVQDNELKGARFVIELPLRV
ncbi:MAG: ATP-binding protein, partial [Deltaproteobacteria bacterium]|nr:ATP-binding protein [Deltaproteobacteria bacterium]